MDPKTKELVRRYPLKGLKPVKGLERVTSCQLRLYTLSDGVKAAIQRKIGLTRLVKLLTDFGKGAYPLEQRLGYS